MKKHVISISKKQNCKKNSLSKDDLITITHDFFKSLNPYFYSYFLKNYKICKDHLVFQRWTDDQPYTGLTLFLGTTKEAYISVNRKYDFEDLATTAHEFAHATDFQINPANFSDKNKDVYVEITSILIELLINDYYYNLTKDKNPIIYKALNHNEFVDMAEDISEFFNLIDIEIKNGQEFKRKKELKKNYPFPLETSGIFSNMNLNPESYLISYIFAIEIYELYKKDKEKALDILDKIIKLSNLSAIDYYHKITELSIYPNINIANYQNGINSDINNIYLTKKNKKMAK